jgi:hypothetical protein
MGKDHGDNIIKVNYLKKTEILNSINIRNQLREERKT